MEGASMRRSSKVTKESFVAQSYVRYKIMQELLKEIRSVVSNRALIGIAGSYSGLLIESEWKLYRALGSPGLTAYEGQLSRLFRKEARPELQKAIQKMFRDKRSQLLSEGIRADSRDVQNIMLTVFALHPIREQATRAALIVARDYDECQKIAL
jgi:hypothetical protein